MGKAIVIGGSAGMGKELALMLAQDGYKVVITGRNSEKLDRVKSANPFNIISFPLDLPNSETEVNLTNMVRELGGLDLLILSAGSGEINPQLNYDIDKRIIDLNISAFTRVINWCFSYFKEQGQGQLVGLTSIAGIRGIRHAPAYAASKSYQIRYLESLRQKAVKEKLKITITEARPGFVDTKDAEVRRFWAASPGKAAKQIYRAIKNKRNVVYITRRWALIGFMLSLIPRFIYNRL
jgi:short-subunit dehydrogenase